MPRPFALVLAPLFLALLALGPATRSGRAEDAPGAEPAPATPSDDARFLPLEAIKPGMRGYGMTVRHGTALERFEVEVIDIARNWLTKQDLILVRCLGDEFADHQIAQGMSGSPIWFDGKLAGALSYTFAWAKHAVGGVTPIHTMLAEGRRPVLATVIETWGSSPRPAGSCLAIGYGGDRPPAAGPAQRVEMLILAN